MGGYAISMPQPLTEFVQRVLKTLGADEEVAAEVANHLVRANLSGHDSHGVIRVPQYVRQVDSGEIVPAARPKMLRESAATAVVDAQRGFGHYSTDFTLEWAMERARQHGLAAVAVRHSTHIGRVGEYTERAAERGLIGIVTVGAAGPGVGGMVLHGGRRRFFGANPWSFAIPATGRPPMMFDGSTSMVAEGKVRVARDKGVPLPAGCIIDAAGRPTTDPREFYAGGALVPLGGEVAGHKGYGLALASALLGGLAMIDDPAPTLIGATVVQQVPDRRGIIAGVFLEVIDPAWFGAAERYAAMVAETLAAAKRVPPVEGAAEVLVPGEPEVRAREQRSREGIPLPEATWQALAAVAERCQVPLPDHRWG